MMDLFRLPPILLTLVFAVLSPASSQFVKAPSYQSVLQSPIDANITISYKEPSAGTCASAYSTQKQFTGYINLPPYTLAPIQQNYSINTFFWFVEARQTPEVQPLTIWLSGGPGTSSMFGLFNEVGPCQVVQTDDGSYGTQVNEWGWDRSSNMLFIDQPDQVGFSFDQATNASLDLYLGEVFEPPTPPTQRLPPFMYLNGTFGTANSNEAIPWVTTANTTEIAAQAVWHFLQGWLSAFPKYNPGLRPNSTATNSTKQPMAGINLFTESYGGKYGPVFATFFEQQNEAIANGQLPYGKTLPIKLETVGILNGKIDDLIQDYYYPIFAYNNTYGIQAISEVAELNEINEYTNYCMRQILQCREALNSTDPNGYGDVNSTNSLCAQAQLTCNFIMNSYIAAGHDPYDIRQMYPTPDPPAAYQEYLNYQSVLSAIGAQVNYTESNPYVLEGFVATGDTIKGGNTNDLANLIALGVRVALIYGDADYICNWLGGEAVSLAIAALLPDYPSATNVPSGTAAPLTYASGFPSAGYADIVSNSTYVGGVARQYGNLSFSRIYESGHFVPFFQPETAFTLFTRIIQGTDLSTGDAIDLSTFGSSGPANATFSTTATYSPAPTCWVRAWNSSCSEDETDAMLAGKGVVANGIYYASKSLTSSGWPSTTVPVGRPGHALHTAGEPKVPLTGVYTATNTPSSGVASALIERPVPLNVLLMPLIVLVVSVGFGAKMIL